MNKAKGQSITYVVPIVAACTPTFASWDRVVSVPLEAAQIRAKAVLVTVTIALYWTEEKGQSVRKENLCSEEIISIQGR